MVCDCFSLAGSLMYLNEATLLHNIKVRYSKDRIYVSIVCHDNRLIEMSFQKFTKCFHFQFFSYNRTAIMERSRLQAFFCLFFLTLYFQIRIPSDFQQAEQQVFLYMAVCVQPQHSFVSQMFQQVTYFTVNKDGFLSSLFLNEANRCRL